jgi:hypothetical protein
MGKQAAVVMVAEVVVEPGRALLILIIPYKVDRVMLAVAEVAEVLISLVLHPH